MDSQTAEKLETLTKAKDAKIDHWKRLCTTLKFEKGNDLFALEQTLMEKHRSEWDRAEEASESDLTRLKRQLESCEAQLSMARNELVEKDKAYGLLTQQLEDTNVMVDAITVNHEATKVELNNLKTLQMANAGWEALNKNMQVQTWEDAQHQDYKDRIEKQH